MSDSPGGRRTDPRYRNPYAPQPTTRARAEPDETETPYGSWFRPAGPTPPHRGPRWARGALVAGAAVLAGSLTYGLLVERGPTAAPAAPAVSAPAQVPATLAGPPQAPAPEVALPPAAARALPLLDQAHVSRASRRRASPARRPRPHEARAATLPRRATTAAPARTRTRASRPVRPRRTASPRRRWQAPPFGQRLTAAYACRHFAPGDWRRAYCARAWAVWRAQLGL